jgi:iron complex transport system ATP-binding protein
MLEIEGLIVDYGPRRVLQGIDLTVQPGEILALIGPNGAGKSTLIKAISGVVPAQAGRIRLDGEDLIRLSPAQRARCLAVVPQARRLPADYTVWQTVLLGRTPYLGWLGQPASQDRVRARWAMEQTATSPLAERRIGELSGGEQQRVLLARAVAQDTPVLLMDEPTAHLDLQHQTALLTLARSLASEERRAILMALHDLNLAALYADRVALLVGGRLRAVGAPEAVLTPELVSSAYQIPVHIIQHPDYGTPLILPDGRM